MEEQKSYEALAAAFDAELQSKGYRGSFILIANEPLGLEFRGKLYDCLKQYLNRCWKNNGEVEVFRLHTYAYYNSDRDYIHCSLTVRLGEAFGFRVSSMNIEDAYSGQSLEYRAHTKFPVPERKQLKTLFPKRGFIQRIFRKGKGI